MQDPRKGGRQRYVKKDSRPPVLETPAHGNGLLNRSGSTSGKPGRLPNALRLQMRELTWRVLEEALRRVDAAERPRPTRAALMKLSKEELVDELLEIDGYMALSATELRQLLDTAAKYGIGTKHVHSGDEDDVPLKTGVIILPALAGSVDSPS